MLLSHLSGEKEKLWLVRVGRFLWCKFSRREFQANYALTLTQFLAIWDLLLISCHEPAPQTTGRGVRSTFILQTRILTVTGAEHYLCLPLAFPFMTCFGSVWPEPFDCLCVYTIWSPDVTDGFNVLTAPSAPNSRVQQKGHRPVVSGLNSAFRAVLLDQSTAFWNTELISSIHKLRDFT